MNTGDHFAGIGKMVAGGRAWTPSPAPSSQLPAFPAAIFGPLCHAEIPFTIPSFTVQLCVNRLERHNHWFAAKKGKT